MLQAIRTRYRELRREVYECATRPSSGNAEKHQANQKLFRNRVEEICQVASLEHYQADNPNAKNSLWHHLWTKNRYAGIRAQRATDEITDLTSLFDNYAWFTDPDWNIQARGYKVDKAGTGQLALAFLDRSGQFKGLRTVGNVPKLKNIVAIARSYTKSFQEQRNNTAIQFVTGGFPDTEVWQIHSHLLNLGYRADLTALHFMMDTGFQVIKPDVVVTRLFLELGWLRCASPNIPQDLTRHDLIGRGRYGFRFKYTKPVIYRPVIDLARDIVRELRPADLRADIGWCTSNPIREFDLFVVKAGQLPEREFGIEQRLYP